MAPSSPSTTRRSPPSKNYRRSVNTQIIARPKDRQTHCVNADAAATPSTTTSKSSPKSETSRPTPITGHLLVEQEQCRGRRCVLECFGEIVELDDVVDLGAHRDVGDPLQEDLYHHGTLVLVSQLLSPLQSRADAPWPDQLNRLAAQSLNDTEMIDAIALRHV